MPRYYKKGYYYKKNKYSAENALIEGAITGANTDQEGFHKQGNFVIVPPTEAQGTRKVKNLTVRFLLGPAYNINKTDPTDRTEAVGNIQFAVVFVPQGTAPNSLVTGTQFISLYEPNQNVILSGVVDNTQTYTFRTRLARNLNSGDCIAIVIRDGNAATDTTFTSTNVYYLICDCIIN